MKPTTEILDNIQKSSMKNKDEVFTRLFRYMLRKDLYYVAYQNLYANRGAGTVGMTNDTADGFCDEKIQKIIDSLADGSYRPTPARRTYIEKANGKLRPLGIPTFTDKLIQEVLKMILEAVYEPIFTNNSHGFRPNRSCHTAIRTIKKDFTGARWFVEGDIKGCFDNINHQVLIDIIGKKIKDARLIQLIWKILKAGYCEQWEYHATHSGTPQGGIVSPMFANIYLHELDLFILDMAKGFNKPATRGYSPEYSKMQWQIEKVNQQIKKADEKQKAELVKKKRELRKKLLQIPFSSQTDKTMKYVRYADDFLIGVKGSKADCVEIKRKLSEFISGKLKMELSDEKTLITHSNTHARFLGYDIRVRRNGQTKNVNGITKRTLNNMVELNIPLEDTIMKFLFDNKLVKQSKNGNCYPIVRTEMLHCTELEIVSSYNAELRGICNYYALASNFNKLNYFAYLMEYSCLKTLAAKHQSSIRKITRKYKDGNGKWGIPYQTKTGGKIAYFADYRKCKSGKDMVDTITQIAFKNRYSRTTFDKRLAAKQCDICGTTEAEQYEVHHVQKVKDLKGKALWEQIMIAKKRKTLVVCHDCHKKIHNGNRATRV